MSITPHQRKLAARACMYMRHELGMSWIDAADAILEGDVAPIETLEALRALDEAGELEHLFTLVFVAGMKLR